MTEFVPTSFNEALINLRNQLLLLSGLDNNYIINGDSIYGPTAYQMVSEIIGKSPSLEDTFIIFEFKEIENDSYGITFDDKNNGYALVSYGLFLKIYGDNSHSMAAKIQAGLKFPGTVEVLYNQGIKYTSLSNISSLNEFINGVRWPRCDIELDILCNLKFNFAGKNEGVIADKYTIPTEINSY